MPQLIWTPAAGYATQGRMTDEPVSDPVKAVKSQRVQHRERRLKAALKANMAKRKAQVRGRSDTAVDDVMSGDVTDGNTNEKT